MEDKYIYYLRSILRQLCELRDAMPDYSGLHLGGQVLADNIDWLDCHINEIETRDRERAIAQASK